MANAEAAAKKRQGRLAETQLDGEVWKQLPDFPGYEASNLGRIRAVRILSTHIGSGGYECVGVYCEGGRQRNQRVNRLVCEAFHGDPDGRQAAHLDGNRLNNRADNLAWTTQSENEEHKFEHGTRWKAGATRGRLDPSDVLLIKARAARGENQSLIAAEFGITQGTVCAIHQGRLWKILNKKSQERAA